MNIWQSIKDWFHNKSKEVKEYLSQSLELANCVRDALNSDIAKTITDIIPGTWDDNLRTEAISILDKVIPELVILDACKERPSTEEMVLCWLEHVKSYPEAMQHATLHKLASRYTAYMHDHKRKESEYDKAVQDAFMEKFNA